MAEQDVHGDALGDRMTEWAQTISPEQTQARVAALLGTPLRADSGQPAALALVNNPVQEQLAAQTTADAAAPVVAPALAAPQAAPTTTAQGVSAMQLPAEVPAAAPAVVAQAATAELPAADPAADVANQHNTMLMAAAPQQDRAMFDAVARAPVQPAIPAVLARPREPAIRHMVKAMPTTAQGTHLVQLGSFASPQGARRAWGIYTARNAALSNYRMTISSAKVHGKTFWRVAAGGINGAGAANGLCSQLKSRGGACFAYAIKTRSVVPSTVPGQSFSGPQRARRR